MTQTPPPRENGGGRMAILNTLLAYIDTPWKAVAIAGLAIVFGLGWLIWTERAAILGVLLRPAARPTVLKSELLPDLNGVLADTTADLVTIWRVDWAANTLSHVLSTGRNGTKLAVDGTVPAVTELTDVSRMARVMNGEAVCAPTGVGLLSQRFEAAGYRFECAAPVPPGVNQLAIGMLILLWKLPPSAVEQTAARTVEVIAADHMVTR